MPFTFAHPSIILPLNLVRKGWFSLTGLVIGSMVPDIEYFVRMQSINLYGHTWAGLIWFNIPVSIIIAFLFHNIIRNSLINNLPVFLQKRLAKYKGFNWNIFFKRNWNMVVISVLIGGLSHFFLDAFTNEQGFFVQAIPALQEMIPWEERRVAVNSILHIFFSIAGLLAVMYAVGQLPVQKRIRTHKPVIGYWVIIAFIAAIIFIVGVVYNTDEYTRTYYYLYYSKFVIIATSAFLGALVLTSFLFRYKMNY